MSWDLVALQGVWLTAPVTAVVAPAPAPGAAPARRPPRRRTWRLQGVPVRYRALVPEGAVRPAHLLRAQPLRWEPLAAGRFGAVLAVRGRLLRPAWGAARGRALLRAPAADLALLGLGALAEVWR